MQNMWMRPLTPKSVTYKATETKIHIILQYVTDF